MSATLHTTQDWEAVKPNNVIYDHFFYNEQKQVTKVKGRIKIVKRIRLADDRYIRKDCFRNVRWDGYGHCHLSTHNTRCRHSDIIFRTIQDNID